MARKTKTVVIELGRDKGKTFLITEMPLLKADRWANRCLLAMLKGGVDVGDVNNLTIDATGGILEMAKIAIGALGNIETETGIDLLNELLDCVQVVPSGGIPRDLLSIDEEIEDLKTLAILRKEAFMIHIDFLTQGNS